MLLLCDCRGPIIKSNSLGSPHLLDYLNEKMKPSDIASRYYEKLTMKKSYHSSMSICIGKLTLVSTSFYKHIRKE